MRSTRRQVAAENGQVGRSTQTNCTDTAKSWNRHKPDAQPSKQPGKLAGVFRVSRIRRRIARFAMRLAAAVALLGPCANASPSSPVDGKGIPLRRAVVGHYAEVVRASYEDALMMVRKLEVAVETFLTRPSEVALNQARQAWVDARLPYLQTEACRFYDSPIEEVEGFINAWPIDENLIDYVADAPAAGIINQPEKYPVITAELLTTLNEKAGERSITTGFHAIEFLLWGQDERADGAGAQSWKDYTTAINATRRGAYLRVATQLLTVHLRQVAAAWASGQADNFRAQFLALDPDVAPGKILKGLGSLSGPELSGETGPLWGVVLYLKAAELDRGSPGIRQCRCGSQCWDQRS